MTDFFCVLCLALHCAFLCSKQSTSQLKLYERERAEAWAKITTIKWKKKLAINKVGNSDKTKDQCFQWFPCFRPDFEEAFCDLITS